MMRKFLLLVAVFVVLAVVTRAYIAGDHSNQPPVAPALKVDIPRGAAERLAGAVRIPTISAEDPAAFNREAFQTLHAYLQAAFPRVHAQLLRETVADHSLLYTWQGSDASLNPILLMGHLDVVPVELGTDEKWQQPPFSGHIVDGVIWGRGAIDNKSTVVGMLEAVEMLLGEGFRPARTVYLAYGHDEEVGGAGGAREIAALLKARGIELEMVLDEGGVIVEGILSGISGPVVLVGIAEKGFATIELNTVAPGGHSSLPPRQTAVGILSAAIARLEASPMRARLEGPTRQLFDRIGPQFPTAQRLVFANLWLTRPLVIRSLENRPTTNAMVRTTTAVTMFHAGTKDNVLPSSAKASINFRILPGDSIENVVRHVRDVVDDDRVQIKIGGRFSAEPSNISSTDSDGFRILERAIRGVAPDVIVAPYLVVVVTDARHYSDLTRNVFRFLPLRLTSPDLERMHGIDERIEIRDYETAIRTYRQLVIEVAAARRNFGFQERAVLPKNTIPTTLDLGHRPPAPAGIDEPARGIRRNSAFVYSSIRASRWYLNTYGSVMSSWRIIVRCRLVSPLFVPHVAVVDDNKPAGPRADTRLIFEISVERVRNLIVYRQRSTPLFGQSARSDRGSRRPEPIRG